MSKSPRQHAKEFAQSLWVYVCLAALLTFIMAGYSGVRAASALSPLFVGNLVLSLSIGASLTLGFTLTSSALDANSLPRVLRLLLATAVFVIAVFVGVEVALQGLRFFSPTMVKWFPRTAVWIVALPVSLTMYFVGKLKERADFERAQKHLVEAQREEAKLAALLARTHPHFLFNSLNSIAALVEEDPKAAERAIVQLAALFRYVLEGAASTQVRLREELAFVRAYVALESLRFGERMEFEVDVDDSLADALILPLLVQPLVENAIRHGVAAKSSRGKVRLRAKGVGEIVRIDVDDDGPGPLGSNHRGSGTSQADMQVRLQLAYGGRARFTTGASELGGFRATLELPRNGP